MSRSHRIGAILLVLLLIVLGALWMLLNYPAIPIETAAASPSTLASARSAEPAASPSPAAAALAAAAPTPAPSIQWEQLERFVAGQGIKPTGKDIERFLAKHGQTPGNLVVAYETSGDVQWLEKALELHPHSPIVLISALSQADSWKDERAAAWVERFKQADPKNPLPWLYAATFASKQGDPQRVMEELRAAYERPGFYTYTNERTSSAQALYQSVGLGPLEAELIGTFSMKVPWLQNAVSVSKSLDAAKRAPAAEATFVQEATHLQYQLGKMFQTPEASRLMIGQLVAVSIEKQGIAHLAPADQEQRKAALDAVREEVRDSVIMLEKLFANRDGVHFAEYIRRVRTEGEMSAIRWLKTQHPQTAGDSSKIPADR